MDIVGLVETHTITGQHDDIFFADFDTHLLHRPKHKKAPHGSGGIAVLLRHNIRKGIKIHQSKGNDYVWLNLNKGFFGFTEDLHICIAYIPPADSTYSKSLKQDILDRIESDINRLKTQGNILLMGDLNGRVGRVLDFIPADSDKHLPLDNYTLDSIIPSRNSQDTTVDDRGKHIIDMCIKSQMRILNGRKIGDSMGYFTSHQYNGSSVVDYAICSEALLTDISYFKVHHFLGSLTDHCMISMYINAKLPSPTSAKSVHLHKLPRQFKWNQGSSEAFQEALQLPHIKLRIKLTLSNLKTNTGNTPTLVDQVTEIFTETAKMALRHKKSKPNASLAKPWDSSQLKRMEREVNKKGREMAKSQTGEHRKNFFLALKIFRKHRKYAKRHYIHNKLQELNDLKDNPKEFWQLLEKLKQGNNKENHADKIDPGTWHNYLYQLNQCHESNNSDNIDHLIDNLMENKTFTPLDFTIKESEVVEAIGKLKNNKSPGMDLVSNDMLKSAKDTISPCLQLLFNKIFTSGEYPESWCKGIVTNIHKKGSFLDPQNYRSITITSAIGKLFNSIMNTRLERYLEENNIISPYQIGFQKNSSTADHLFSLKTIINKYTQKGGGKLYTCFVDFKQAFDRVWHQGLLLKLAKLNINNLFFTYIKNMYAQIELFVKVGDHTTKEPIKSEIGVRQGDNLSPTLFKIYINDLQQYIDRTNNTHPVTIGTHKLNCLLYADDIVLISTSKIGLQNCINALYNYSSDWKLDVNLTKTKSLIFNKKGQVIMEEFMFGKDKIEGTDSYTYLGIKLTNNGNFQEAINTLCTKALKSMFKIDKLIDESYGIKTTLHIFDHAIRPILLYGSEVWGGDIIKINSKIENKTRALENYLEKNSLSTIELKFYKRLLKVKRNTATMGIRGELGRYPISIQAVKNFAKFINIIDTRKEGSLIKAALAENKSQHQAGQKNTLYGTYASLINTLKLKPLSNESSKNKIKKFANKIETAIKAKYRTYWSENLAAPTTHNKKGGNKLRTYRLLKQNFMQERYLELVDNNIHRKSLTQLRLSCHPLNIEHLRGKVPDPNDRLCMMCDKQEIEDEIHFVTSCPKYTNERRALLGKIREYANIDHLSARDLFIWLLTNENRHVCKNVARFTHECFKIRKLTLVDP